MLAQLGQDVPHSIGHRRHPWFFDYRGQRPVVIKEDRWLSSCQGTEYPLGAGQGRRKPPLGPPLALHHQFGQVSDHYVGTMGLELCRLFPTVRSDDRGEASRAACLHPGQGVLDHHRPVGRDAQPSGRFQYDVRRRLPPETQFLCIVAVDHHFEEVAQPRALQDLLRILACGEQGEPVAAREHVPYEADRRIVGLRPVPFKVFDEVVVLPVADPMDRMLFRPVGRISVRKGYAARRQERCGPLISRLPVDITEIVGAFIERCEVLARAGALPEQFVERAFPRRGMNARGVRDDPIHVQYERIDAVQVQSGPFRRDPSNDRDRSAHVPFARLLSWASA